MSTHNICFNGEIKNFYTYMYLSVRQLPQHLFLWRRLKICICKLCICDAIKYDIMLPLICLGSNIFLVLKLKQHLKL